MWANLAAGRKEHEAFVSRIATRRRQRQLFIAFNGWADHLAALRGGRQIAEQKAKLYAIDSLPSWSSSASPRCSGPETCVVST